MRQRRREEGALLPGTMFRSTASRAAPHGSHQHSGAGRCGQIHANSEDEHPASPRTNPFPDGKFHPPNPIFCRKSRLAASKTVAGNATIIRRTPVLLGPRPRSSPYLLDRNGHLLKFDQTTRRRMPAWSVIVTLALAVSSWGLQYKLSLYHAAGVRHSMPAAKLLSQKERPVASSLPEASLLAGQPVGHATHPIVPDHFAALPANAYLEAQRSSEEPPASPVARALPRLLVSPAGPRAPPVTA